MVPIIAKRIHELTGKEYKQCWGLNLGINGDMQGELVFERNQPVSNAVAVMLKEDERILAWALMQPPGGIYGNNWAAEFYVRPSERRKGYGSRLMRYVQYHFTPVQCWAYDNVSGGFFRNFENQIVCDKDTRTWIEGVKL